MLKGKFMGMLEGKVVLVTGAARGQGRAHAVASARQGADVVLLDVASQIETAFYPLASKEDLDETVRLVRAEGREAVGLVGDVRSQQDVDAAVGTAIREFGKVDALIANAAIVAPMVRFWEIDERNWLDAMDVNLSGVWMSVKAVAAHMSRRQSGSIVITSSVNGLEPGESNTSYATAKHALIGLTKNVALELAPFGVRCNAVCPGVIDTPMVDNTFSREAYVGPGATRSDLLQSVYHFHALRGTTLMQPDVVADTGVFLNSAAARGITGAVVPVDAGHLLLAGYNHAPIRSDVPG